MSQHCILLEATALQKLKSDLERLLEDQGMKEFKDVIIEGYSVALLDRYD